MHRTIETAPIVDKERGVAKIPKTTSETTSIFKTPVHVHHEPQYIDLKMEMMGSLLEVNLSEGHFSSRFNPIIEMVRSTGIPASDIQIANIEGSASSPMDEEIGPEQLVVKEEVKMKENQANLDPTFRTLVQISFFCLSFVSRAIKDGHLKKIQLKK
ncbi:hypothetical protein GBA52_003310 [Prunus armeniaca]|nr:hypothetical protein GBA52_003310 [Prunus armeniaca]